MNGKVRKGRKMRKRLIIGMSGASGAPLTIELLKQLQQYKEIIETHLIVTKGAEMTLEQETDYTLEQLYAHADEVHDNYNIGAGPASGSYRTMGMIVIPCSMKTLAGIVSGYSAIENGTLALRYVCSNKNVTIVIPGMAEEKEIEENIKACLDDSPLSEKELEEVQTVRNQLGTNFCRRCNYCAPCSVGIDISGVFLFAGYLNRYGLGDWARNRYSSLAVKASACIECGKCETRCPYHLPIREMLKECAQQFGE